MKRLIKQIKIYDDGLRIAEGCKEGNLCMCPSEQLHKKLMDFHQYISLCENVSAFLYHLHFICSSFCQYVCTSEFRKQIYLMVYFGVFQSRVSLWRVYTSPLVALRSASAFPCANMPALPGHGREELRK